MVVKKFIIIFCLVLFMSNANAKIIEVDNIQTVSKELLELGPNDLITIDVRSVLFSAKDIILTMHYKKQFKKIFSDLREKLGDMEAERLHSIVLKNYEPTTVDPYMVNIIKKIQDKKLKIIALTSGKIGKYGEIENREELRINTLKNLGYDFSSSFPLGNIILDNKPYKTSLVYKNGILFTSNALKGDSLGKFLDHIKLKPRKIIHIDNSMRMLTNMESYCKENNIEFLGVHFTRIYKTDVEFLDPKIVEKQFEILQTKGKWISDNTAKEIIEQNSTID